MVWFVAEFVPAVEVVGEVRVVVGGVAADGVAHVVADVVAGDVAHVAAVAGVAVVVDVAVVISALWTEAQSFEQADHDALAPLCNALRGAFEALVIEIAAAKHP